MPKGNRLYAKPMLPGDAARVIERVLLILRAETDRFQREVDRLNGREMVTHKRALELQRVGDMRIPRVVTPDNAKPVGRPRKTLAAQNSEA